MLVYIGNHLKGPSSPTDLRKNSIFFPLQFIKQFEVKKRDFPCFKNENNEFFNLEEQNISFILTLYRKHYTE